jgi:hypothetical protein
MRGVRAGSDRGVRFRLSKFKDLENAFFMTPDLIRIGSKVTASFFGRAAVGEV